MEKLRLAVMASTRGTTLQGIIDAIESGKLDAEIAVVISDKENAFALERAKKHGIKAEFIDPKKFSSREEFDEKVMEVLERENIQLVCLIGYLRWISKKFVEKWRNRAMNVHPSLLPEFAGKMNKDVHKAVLEAGKKVSGCTIFFVDESEDAGPVIAQKEVKVEEGESVESLKEKVQEAEKELFPWCIQKFAEGKIKVEGKKVKAEE